MLTARRRLLLAEANRLAAYRWDGGTLNLEAKFAADEAGIAAFSTYLATQRGSNFYMLADVPEEGFQLELLPFVQGADRTILIQRKLSQFFYGSPLTTGVSLGRERTGRRDERMLLAALTRPQGFDPWLGALRSAESQLAGIYSIPLLVADLASQLKIKAERCLVLSIGHGGIRQTFLEGGKLRFSRLSPLAASGTDEIARACAAESARIYQYLSQRLIARAAMLPVAVLVHPAAQAAFAAACTDSDELHFEFVDLLAAAKTCGLKTPPKDSSADTLFLHLLAHQPPREQFAPPAERRMFRIWQARFALKATGAVAMFGCLLFATNELVEIAGLRQQSDSMLAQAQSDGQRYAEIMQSLPPMPASLEDLRAVMTRYDALEKRSAPPKAMFDRISAALDESPRIELDRIEWSLSARPEDIGASVDLRRAANAPSADGGQAMHAVAVVTGILPRTEAGDQRAMLETVNEFAATLRHDPAMRVAVLRMPVDVESAKTLRSGSENPAAAEVSRFSVRLSYPIGSPAR
jgi:hypothetical protein